MKGPLPPCPYAWLFDQLPHLCNTGQWDSLLEKSRRPSLFSMPYPTLLSLSPINNLYSSSCLRLQTTLYHLNLNIFLSFVYKYKVMSHSLSDKFSFQPAQYKGQNERAPCIDNPKDPLPLGRRKEHSRRSTFLDSWENGRQVVF